MYKFRRKVRKFITFVAFLAILGQSFSPYLYILPKSAYAQEATDSASLPQEVTPTPIESEQADTATPTPLPAGVSTETVTPAPVVITIVSPEPTPPQAPSQWTFEKVELNKEYIAPQNSGVKLTFTKLPATAGNIKIEEIILTKEQIQQTGSLSDKAYDITSDMADGSFTYNLSLPIPDSSKGKAIEVKFAEELSKIGTAEKVENTLTTTDKSVSVTSLDHFTIFVISGTITNPGEDTYVGEPFDETLSQVIINEFVYNPSTGNEWIELFNKTGEDINLENWQLVDDNDLSSDLSLTGTLPANGILVFEKSGGDGWLNNTGLESITLKDNNAQTKDVVSYKDNFFVNGQNIGNVAEDQSVCRTEDAGDTWEVCSSPTKGWFNNAETFDCVNPPSGAPTLTSIADCLENYQGIYTNIGMIDNPSATPETDGALYFEKDEGKIVFEKILNLSDQDTVNILQSLGTAMEMSYGHIKFDSTTAAAMAATGAKIYMYELNYETTPEIVIKDDTGAIVGTTNDSSADDDIDTDGINYDLDTGELSFTALHFTQFDVPAAPSAPVRHEVSSPTNDTTPTLSWDDVSATPEVTSYDLEVYDSEGNNIYDGFITTISSSFTPEDPLPDDDYTWYVMANNSIGTSDWSDEGSFTIETIAPTVQSIQTMDSDGDGHLDGIQLTFDEEINDDMLDMGNPDGWDVADPAGEESIGTGEIENDNVLVLSFGEGPTPDTANVPSVTYTPSGGPTSTHDLAGNELGSYSGVPEDKALPVLITAVTKDTDTSGQIDAIELTFSEEIDDDWLILDSADGWDVSGYDGVSIGTGTIGSDNILLLTFDESGSLDTGVTPLVSYTEGGGDGSTHDSAGNELAAVVDFTSIDGAAPRVPEADPGGSDYSGDQSVSLSSSDENGPAPDIYYTIDGSEPNNEDGTLYTDPILIDKDTTLKAIAYDSAGNASGVLTEEYGIAPVISGETTSSVTTTGITITWTTDDPSTSRVIYGTAPISDATVATFPDGSNYGYVNSTVEDSTLVTAHSVGLTGLTAGSTYYYRTISHGSPEAVSSEKTFSTTSASTTSSGGGSLGSGGGAGDGRSDGKSDGRSDGRSDGLGQSSAVLASSTSTGGGTTGEVLGAGTEEPTSGTTIYPTPTPEKEILGAVQSKGKETKTGNFISEKWWLIPIFLVSIIISIVLFKRRKKSE